MPVDIAGLRKRGVDVTVPFFDDEIIVTYDPITISSPTFRQEWDREQKKLLGEVSDWMHGVRDELRKLPLRDDFPGRAHLASRGIETVGDVPLEVAKLKKIRGIGNVTALGIVNAVNQDVRIDNNEFERRKQAVYAQLALKLIRGWDLLEGGEPLALEPESFAGLPGLAEAITEAVWTDANALGKKKPSTVTS